VLLGCLLLAHVLIGIWSLAGVERADEHKRLRVEGRSMLASLIPAAMFVLLLIMYLGQATRPFYSREALRPFYLMQALAWLFLFFATPVVVICQCWWLATCRDPGTNWRSRVCQVLGLALAVAACYFWVAYCPSD
jgi:hypothetical protein